MAKRTYDGRTLREALESLPKKQVVKVGAVDGSGYFLAGDAGWIAKSLNNADFFTKRYWNNRLEVATEKMRKTLDAPTYADWLKQQYQSAKELKVFERRNLTYDAYVKDMKGYHEAVEKRIKTAIKLLDIVMGYEPVPERRVVEIFTANPTVDADVLNIHIDGNEPGTVWFMQEADPNKYLYLEGVNEEETKNGEE